MIKKTVEISREPAHVSVRHSQLTLKRGDQFLGQIACEDIGLLVVDHPQTTYSHAALVSLAVSGATVVLCGDNHLPIATLLPLASHSQLVWRLQDQIGISEPLRKKLWSQLVVAKIKAQASNLLDSSSSRKRLLVMAQKVKSGDSTNVEAQAARIYWENWLTEASAEELDRERFRRDPEQSGLNSFLNYGYAIVRAALGRSIVSAGLHPSIGLMHRNRSNMFCLADDLIEPFRPVVDDRVREMFRLGYEDLNQTAKAELLTLLTIPMQLNGMTGPMLVMMERLVASLVRCFAKESKSLEIPTVVH